MSSSTVQAQGFHKTFMISNTNVIVWNCLDMKKTLTVLCCLMLFSYALLSSDLLSRRFYWTDVCRCGLETNAAANGARATPEESGTPLWERPMNFEGFNNETGTEDGRYIVPNYVHFVKFGQPEFSFVHAVCVLAAFKHQRPEKIFFHTEVQEFRGKYWEVIVNTPGFRDVLVMRKMEVPSEIFGQKLNDKKWKYMHSGDVARLQVLMEFGGLYLDSDTYIVRSLNDFRRFEFSIGWRLNAALGNQMVVAHKNARFLKLWYESYRNNYEPSFFYRNAGYYPTQYILRPNPHLVHRVPTLFGNFNITKKVYLTRWPEWREYYSLHMLFRRLNKLEGLDPELLYPVDFNETNVLDYRVAFRDMCIDVYPYAEKHRLVNKVL